MMKIYNIYTFTLMILFTGCISSEKNIHMPLVEPVVIEEKCFLEEEEAPLWVCEKPISNNAYVAISHIHKDNDLEYTLGDARALARADIAEQIRTEVYSKAVLTQKITKNESNTVLESKIVSTSKVEFNENKNKYREKIWISNKNEVFLRLELEK